MNSKDLLDENRQLRRTLKAYESNANLNEKKLRRFQQHELRFISASGLQDLLSAIFNEYREEFRLDALTLVLIDPEYEIRRVMGNLGITETTHPDLLFVDDATSLQDYINNYHHPRLGACTRVCQRFLFPAAGTMLSSMALFPLVRQGELIGSLNIGSHESQRYIPGAATDFLERLAAIIAVCLENAINNEKLKLLGLLDPLTGVHNRRYFDQRLEEEVERCLRDKSTLSCLFLDVDHFKLFNDRHGHHVGDLVLRDVAGLIKRQMRASDVMARFGGEEFAALLAHSAEQEAMEIAERIRHSVANHRASAASGEQLRITVSIGCSSLQGNSDATASMAAKQLVEQADRALYRAKQNGRNRVSYMALDNPGVRNLTA